MYEEFEAEIAALERKYADKPRGSVVFYGSSSIRLWPGLSRTFPGVVIENWGFGGSTLRAGAHYFERLIVPRAPRGIVFYGGDNDLFLGSTPQEVWESLARLLDARDTQLSAVPFAFISLKPSPVREHLLDAVIETNEWCRRELVARENAIWAETFDSMLDDNREPRDELFLADQLHLSRAGYDVWNGALKLDVPWLAEPVNL